MVENKTPEIDRYEDRGEGHVGACMRDAADGEYVFYDDHTAIVTRITAELSAANARAETAEAESATLRKRVERLEGFAQSFHFTCVEESFYKDCYLHLNTPDSVTFRLGNGSQFSKFIAQIEERRRAAIEEPKP